MNENIWHNKDQITNWHVIITNGGRKELWTAMFTGKVTTTTRSWCWQSRSQGKRSLYLAVAPGWMVLQSSIRSSFSICISSKLLHLSENVWSPLLSLEFAPNADSRFDVTSLLLYLSDRKDCPVFNIWQRIRLKSNQSLQGRHQSV